MQVHINGKPHTFSSLNSMTINDLLVKMALNSKGIALAINNTVVTQTDWSIAQVQDNDRIDIFSVVAGG